MRERERRELTKGCLEGGAGIGIEKDRSSDGEEHEKKNKIAKLHHHRVESIRSREIR